MERPRVVIPKETQQLFEHIFNNAMNIPLVLEAAPTKASDMKGNVFGFYSNKLYIVLSNGSLYSITLTAV